MPGIIDDDDALEIDLNNLPEEGDNEEIVVGAQADDEPDENAQTPVSDRPSRRERRGNRVNELLEAERKRADAAEARHAEMMRTMQTALARPVYAQQVAPQQPQGPDPYEVQAQQLRQQQEMMQEAFQAAHARGDEAAKAQLQRQAWELRERMEENSYIRHARRYGAPGQQAQQPQLTPQQLEDMVDRRAVVRRFQEELPDIAGNERASKVFQANYNKRMALGHPDAWSTLMAAAEETRHELRLKPPGGRPAASAATRSRLSGMSTGASTASGSTGPRVVKMTKMNRRLADATYPHLPEAQRYQKWAREVGAKVPEEA